MSDEKIETDASEEEEEIVDIEVPDVELEEDVDIDTPVEEIEPSEEEFIEEEEIIDERIYTIPLRRAYWTGSRRRRANKAVKVLRDFVERHMKPEELLIQPEVNERIWDRGIQKPPRRIRIRATKNSDNLVRVYLAEG
jgi:large subunit ribosomal protein L31e